MKNTKNITSPVYHALKFHPRSYAKVYWPTKQGCVCIANDSNYVRPNGSQIQVTSIFEGKLYPMINYTIDGSDKTYATSLHWFANNIAS